MKDILETIIVNLVDNKEEVSINEKQDEQGIVFEVKVAESDMGKIIGKQGKKTAKSIRTVMKAISSKEKKKVTVEFLDN